MNSNLLNDGFTKTVIWATKDPKLVNGKLGEINFNLNHNDLNGKIWIKNFIINDQYINNAIKISYKESKNVSDGINFINEIKPNEFNLLQNFPNPFNPQTNIFWSMPEDGQISIEIYNLNGQLIDILFNGYKKSGHHQIMWNATRFPSGIYFYRLSIDGFNLQKKMILLR